MFTDVESDEPSPAALRDIGDARVRNLVRGILSANKERVLRRTIERFRSECTPQDALTAFRFLRDSPLARQLSWPEPFPANTTGIDHGPPFEGPLATELIGQRVRFERHGERLLRAIHLLGSLNASILSRDVVATTTLFSEYREHFGISLLVAFKAISVRHSAVAGSRGRLEHSEVLTPFIFPRRQLLTVAFEDSVSPLRDYMRVRRSYLGFISKNKVPKASAAILADLFSPLAYPEIELAKRLQTFGRWGLLDSLAYLFRLRRLMEVTQHTAELAAIDATVPAPVAAAWTSMFSNINISAIQQLVGGKSQFFERNLFAHLPAWSEYPELLDYRLRVERAIGPRLDGHFPAPRHSAPDFVSPRSKVDDLIANRPRITNISTVVPASCGAFHRTIALIASVEHGPIEILDGEQLSLLLDQTVDVASLLSKDELVTFLPRRREDPLYEFLRASLLSDLEESKVSQHALRRAIQRVVVEKFAGDIVRLIDHLHSADGHVSGYIYGLCTEVFLTELYDLYEEADQVTEAQTDILEWRASRTQDEDAANRAKSHRLNLRLRKVRGAIEETRIYVDPLRFLQWVQEEVTGELQALSSEAEEILADSDCGLSLGDPVQIAVRPRLKLLRLLDTAYKEFCDNKIYGATSFIGRRIRHGTLHGYLVLELRPEVEATINEFNSSAPQFAGFLANWLRRFDAAVLQMAADRIHVNSAEKPRGLLFDTIDDNAKAAVANAMLKDVAVSLRDRPKLAHSVAVIHEYCWLLFEVDLKRMRDAIESLRRSLVITVEEDRFTERPELERRVTESVRSLNYKLDYKFGIVSSWLTRPSNLSPSASVSLLSEAVLDEVRQRYPGFAPSVEITGANEVDLIGHRFHFFYDALYILVDNAAKHGARPGALRVAVTASNDDPQYIDLGVSVTSEIVPHALRETRILIDDAMQAEVGDAMVKEGRSGIRKLRGLVEDVDEIVGFDHKYGGESVVFTIRMRYLRA